MTLSELPNVELVVIEVVVEVIAVAVGDVNVFIENAEVSSVFVLSPIEANLLIN